MEWQSVVLIGIGLIVGGCIISSIFEHIMDLLQPQRLERFKTKNYSNGVKDATRRIKIDKN